MKYGARGHQRIKKGIRGPRVTLSAWVISSPIPDCAVNKTISSMFHWRHFLPFGHSKALSHTGGNKGKSAKLTARGEEVVRKAERSVTCEALGRNTMGGRVLPKALQSHAPSEHCPSCDERR